MGGLKRSNIKPDLLCSLMRYKTVKKIVGLFFEKTLKLTKAAFIRAKIKTVIHWKIVTT